MPSLGLSLGLSSAGSSFRDSGAVQQISGFPLRIRAFNGVSSINLYRTSQNAGSVEYFSDNAQTYVYWNFTDNYGEFYLNNFSVLISAPTLASVPTSWPSTGWGDGWQFGVANSTLVTLSYTSPQSFEYSNSVPSIVFTSSPVINANLFTISGLSSSNLGSQNAVISMERADYYLSNSVTIPVTITKKNVTLSINNQSSTYSPNATYNWFSAVGISTLAAGDTIQGRFNSDLLTGVPATNANAGSYTISFNPNYTSANYNITNSPASATWTINKASQTITFNPSGTALTTDSTNLSASSTSGLAVSFSVVSGPGSINGSTLTYSGAGSVVVRASQAGNGNYDPATNVDRTITVSAPQASGIPVASTNQIRLTTTNSYYNSYAGNGYGVPPHEKKTNSVQGNDLVLTQGLGYFSPGYGNSYGNIVLAPNSILFSNWDGAVLVNAQNTWTFWQVKFSYGEESSGYFDASFLVATNPSTDSTTIPTAGWSSAITIVPSGIPVASTASFLILWATYIYSYNYRTMSRLEPNQTIDIGYASWNSGPNRNYRLESSYQIELIAPGNLSTIGGSAGYLISLNGPKNYWRLIRVSTNCSDGECDTNVEESINFTNFTNPEYFPDTGYPNGFSYTL